MVSILPRVVCICVCYYDVMKGGSIIFGLVWFLVLVSDGFRTCWLVAFMGRGVKIRGFILLTFVPMLLLYMGWVASNLFVIRMQLVSCFWGWYIERVAR
jgi:hypothetical protein